MSQNAEDRTEQPTPSRREEARQEGRAPRSRDLTVALSLLGGFSALHYYGPDLGGELQSFLKARLETAISSPWQVTGENFGALAAGIVIRLGLAVGPLLAVVALTSLACGTLQSGLTFRLSAVAPDWNRVHPFGGIQRLVSAGSLGRGFFAVLKLGVVGWLLLSGLRSLAARSQEALLTVDGPRAAKALLAEGWDECSAFGMRLSLALVVLAVADCVFQYWLHERSLRMTPQELREELLRMEGSRVVKDHRRRLWGQVHAREQRPQISSVSPAGGA